MGLFLVLIFNVSMAQDAWHEVLSKKQGQVTFCRFIYNEDEKVDDSKDVLDAVERDLAQAFLAYLNQKYGVEIRLHWKNTSTFAEVFDLVAAGEEGIFGASSISITKERAAYVNFTPPFLADIAVLLSSPDVPLLYTAGEFKLALSRLRAISIENTTLSSAIEKLAQSLGLSLETTYVANNDALLEAIEATPSSFGYVDLPNFLVSIKKNSKIRRQFFYPIKLEGLAIIYPKGSDWQSPVEDYFNSAQFLKDKNEIVTRYFGEEITQVIDQIAKSAEIGPFEEIAISSRERQLQYEGLLLAAKRDRENNRLIIFFIILISVLILTGLALLISSKLKTKLNLVLKENKDIIEDRNEQLRKLNEEKNDLIGVLAHDLRSPLSSIKGCAVLLKESEDLNEESKKIADYINQSSNKINDMILKILDVEAIESGNKNMKMESLALKGVIEEVLLEQQAHAGNKSISLNFREQHNYQVSADYVYLSQVIENLISNAIKFSKRGDAVHISTAKKQDLIRITVADHGQGIAKKDQEKIFKKFQTIGSRPTEGEDSVGLGLSIVKKYTEMMGGVVSFHSVEGEGSSFYVDLKEA